MMNRALILFMALLAGVSANAQLNRYLPPVAKKYISKSLGDTVPYEVLMPKVSVLAPNQKYPVYVVFDRQNEIGYERTLQAIDFLTNGGSIPEGIVIGISLPRDQRRYLWTSTKGKAGALLQFVTQELPAEEKLNLTERFTLLVGHSRTAMFALYAFAKAPEKINAVYAASAWHLGADGTPSIKEFEGAMDKIKNMKAGRQLFFSSGGNAAGDGHEKACRELEDYLKSKTWPQNFKWRFYFEESADHFSNYGLFVDNALFNMFGDYRGTFWECTALLEKKDSVTSLPWAEFDAIMQRRSKTGGYEVRRDITFYNSMASALSFNLSNVPDKYRTPLTKEVLVKAMEEYPEYDGFHSWYAEILLAEGNREDAKFHFLKAIICVDKNPWYNDDEKEDTKVQIIEMAKVL